MQPDNPGAEGVRLDATSAEVPPWVTDLQLLDAEIARRVFGHQIPERVTDWANRLAVPPYSSRIEHAWMVVERMRDLWTEYTERQGDKPPMMWEPAPFDDGAFFDKLHRRADRRWPWAFLYVTPEAICHAALSAIEGKQVDA